MIESAGGGIAFIIHNSVKYNPVATVIDDDHLEVQGISVQGGNMDIHILNVYIPPVSACKAGYSASIQPLPSGENKIISSI